MNNIQETMDKAREVGHTLSEEVPMGYKRTEIGVIPEKWDVTTLGEITTIRTGSTPPTHDIANYGDEYPFVSPVDLGGAKYAVKTEKMLSKKGFAISQQFPADSILFVSIGSTIGKCGIAPTELTSNQQINAVLPSPNFSTDYLYYTICSVASRIKALAGEQAVPIVNKTQFSETIIPLAPLSEQCAIAETLSDVDGLLAALEALIAKKRAIKQAAMQQLLTGKTRLPGFSGKWTELNMAHNSILKARIGWQGLTTAEYLTIGEYYLVTGTDFVRGRVDWTRCFFVDHSRFRQDTNIQLALYDVLLTKDGTIGKAGFIDSLPRPATLNSGIFVIRPKAGAYIPKYMYYVLTSQIFDDFLARLQAGSTISHLYQKDFVDFTFKAPLINEQQAIVAVLTDMDAEIAALERRRDKTRIIKQGMMQQLLTGRIRLVKPE